MERQDMAKKLQVACECLSTIFLPQIFLPYLQQPPRLAIRSDSRSFAALLRVSFLFSCVSWLFPQLRLLARGPLENPIADQLQNFGRHRLFDLAVFRGRACLAMLKQVIQARKLLDRIVGIASIFERL